MDENFIVSLNDIEYEGPLSILLDMIKRSEKSIYEISLTDIIAQFSDYIKQYENYSLDTASEFIVKASEFHLYKSKMLIPRDFDSDGQTEHLHFELVQQLLEFQKFKIASEDLDFMQGIENSIIERKEKQRYTNDNNNDSNDDDYWEDVKLYDLVYSFAKIFFTAEEELAIFSNKATLYLEDAINMIKLKLQDNKNFQFVELFSEGVTKRELVTFFLAILEMVKENIIKLRQDKRFKEIYIFPYE